MSNLYFNELQPHPERKTRVWEVTAIASDAILGRVHFYGAWRKFVFSPAINTLFDPGCLRDIAEFAEEASKKWRAEVAARATRDASSGERERKAQ